ncbi:MAG: GTP cyclohydrolase I FolE [Gracilibacteraceae bacterium]|jgi:GTP cyclohydrolase I|nr:GTP cyclohydrolase I FolE [Gracilibacteraceae bacterium]
MDKDKIAQAVRLILEAIGEDPEREGLRDTPRRVAAFYAEAFGGMTEDPARHLDVRFDEGHEEMVIVKAIPLYSMCEHHLLPFFGKTHVAYIPRRGQITGVSKLVRVMEGYARRPQLQERLTTEIAEAIMNRLSARGVMVIIEAEHMCMTMRGVRKAGSVTVTSAVRGEMCKSATRAEVLALIRG